MSSEGYAKQFNQRKALDRASNSNDELSQKLLTDRGAYMSFLEVQLERVSSAVLTVQGHSDRIDDIDNKVGKVENKTSNLSEALRLQQQYLEKYRQNTAASFKEQSSTVGSLEEMMKRMEHRLNQTEEKLEDERNQRRSNENRLSQTEEQLEEERSKRRNNEKRLSEIEEQLEEERSKRRHLENEINRLSVALTENNEKQSTLHSSLESIRSETRQESTIHLNKIEHLESSVSSLQQNYERKFQSVAESGRISELEDRVASIDEQSKNNDRQISGANEHIRSLRCNVEEFRSQTGDLSRELSKQQEDGKAMKQQVDSVKDSVSELEKAHTTINSRLSSVEDEVEATERALQRSEKELIEKVNSSVSGFVTEHECQNIVQQKVSYCASYQFAEELERRIQGLGEELERSNEAATRIREISEESRREGQKLHSSVRSVEDEISGLKNKCETAEQSIEKEVSKVNEELKNIRQENHKLVCEAQESLNKLGERMTQRNNDTNERIQRQSHLIEDMTNRLQRHQAYIDTMNQKFVSREEHGDTHERVVDLKAASRDHHSSIQELEKNLSALQQECDRTKDGLHSTDHRLISLQDETQGRFNELSNELESTQQAFVELRHCVDSLFDENSMLNTMRNDLASLRDRLNAMERVSQSTIDGSRQVADTCMQYADSISDNVTSTMKRMEKRVMRIITGVENEKHGDVVKSPTRDTRFSKEDLINDNEFLERISNNVSSVLHRRLQQQVRQLGDSMKDKLKTSLEDSVNMIENAESQRMSAMEEQILRIRDTVVSLRSFLENVQRAHAAQKVHDFQRQFGQPSMGGPAQHLNAPRSPDRYANPVQAAPHEVSPPREPSYQYYGVPPQEGGEYQGREPRLPARSTRYAAKGDTSKTKKKKSTKKG
eukprot:gb/GECG01008279.1/.p1 GENE.gb/GECG01008279.1/~~gb/GECG01008279.1/.p1  ORF type:complete len:894 (+),score=181.63 gb/GECG01008279.1/:1-2682(+)